LNVPAPYWKNRVCRPDEFPAIQKLLRAVHGDRYPWLNEAYWHWRYEGHPDFRAVVVGSDAEGQLIGLFTMSMLEFQWGTDRLQGAMHSGLITHPEHRRRGVFQSLEQSIHDHAAERGAALIRSTPNESSLPGFLKFGGWAYPGMIPVYFKPLSVPAMLRPKLGRALGALVGGPAQLALTRRRRPLAGESNCEPAERVPDELDEVFEEFARTCGALMSRRTAAYWNWRYGVQPAFQYRTLVARRQGRLLGASVTSVQEFRGIPVGLLLDVVVRGGITELRQLLRHTEDDLRQRGIGLLACQATSPMLQQALAEERYWRPNPARLPKKFHYIFRITGLPGLPRPPADFADWHITFGDSDNA
jgi:GNAT superfamily N-acetyltransferase